jgi:uncharacterized membrane protein required for colicin V production
MPPVVIDIVISLIILGITYALMSEGLWGAALMFFNVLFSALFALNFYEPLATLIVQNASFMGGWADMTCLMLIFIVSLVVIRIITEQAAPTMVRFPRPVYHIGRVVFAFLGACTTVAFLLLCFHTAPVNKKIFGAMTYNSKNPFGQGIDHALLGFFQYSTGHIFSNYEEGLNPNDDEFRNVRVFDPKASWMIDHQNARIGSGTVPEEEAAAAPVPDGGAAGGGNAPMDR